MTGSAILPLAIWTHCARSPLQSLLQHRHSAIDSSGTSEHQTAVSKRLVDFRRSRCAERATRHVDVNYCGWTALIPRQLRAIAAIDNDRIDRPVCADTAPSFCQETYASTCEADAHCGPARSPGHGWQARRCQAHTELTTDGAPCTIGTSGALPGVHFIQTSRRSL